MPPLFTSLPHLARPQAAWPGSAPPAGWYEVERQGGTAKSLAEAVLCGLPAHDEAVAVARVAAASGRSIQEVLEWSRQGDYKATAYRVAARGRIQAPTGPVGAGTAAGRGVAFVRLLECSGWDAPPPLPLCSRLVTTQLVGGAAHSLPPAAAHARRRLPGPAPCAAAQESLYAEAASWANPWELEQQLAAAAERRKRGLSGAELRAVRERKKEIKRQKQTAWLFT